MEDNNQTGADLEVGATTNDSPADTSPATEHVESAPKTESVRDAVMRAFEKTSGEPKMGLPKLAGADTAQAAPADPAKSVDPVTGRELEAIKAPASMSPALREKWGTVDRQMQQYWIDRERDMSVKLQETAAERKLAQDFRAVVAPYEALLRSSNVSATKHVEELMNLSYGLNTGSPQQKAQILGQLIHHFRPDRDTLSAVLSGAPVQAQPQQQAPNVQAEIDKALKARDQAAMEKTAMDGVNAFAADPKNEFLADVQGLMEKAIDAGFVSGNTMPELLKNAYDFACQQHPEVRNVLAQRAAGQATAQAGQPAGKAIPGIKPSLGTGRSTAQSGNHKTVRGAALAAWEKHSK